MDDENVPVEANIFDSSPAHELIEELSHKANAFVAQKLVDGMPEKAFVRRHQPPSIRRLQTFTERMTQIGYDIDTESSATLQTSLFWDRLMWFTRSQSLLNVVCTSTTEHNDVEQRIRAESVGTVD